MKHFHISQGGEKMTTDEVNAIFSIDNINKDGKFNYAEVSKNVFVFLNLGGVG